MTWKRFNPDEELLRITDAAAQVADSAKVLEPQAIHACESLANLCESQPRETSGTESEKPTDTTRFAEFATGDDRSQPSLDHWIDFVEAAKDSAEVFQILDAFRPLEWRDEERATMSHVYHERLRQLYKSDPTDGVVIDLMGYKRRRLL